MNLKTFVKETLVQICDGVQDAANELNARGAIVNPDGTNSDGNATYVNNSFRRTVQQIEFDVALTATQEEGTQGGIAIVAGVIGIGTRGKSETISSSTSRIKFSVPIALPTSNNQ
jgi:hypothetical protein